MSETRIDPEQLAALLDGRLDERQRAEILARLAKSPEAFEAYVDAVAISGELEGERGGAGADVIPLRKPARRSGFRVARWQWLAAAAVVAGVAVVPLVRRGPTIGGAVEADAFVEALASKDAGLPSGWNGRPWSTTRAATDPLTPETRAVRLGARLVDLELAVRSRDTAAGGLATEVAALLDDIPASGPVSAVYREVSRRAGAPPEQLRPLLQSGYRAALQLAGAEYVPVGAWVEAARIAAARRDASFFRSKETRLALERAGQTPVSPGQAHATIRRIRSVAADPGATGWNSLERDLTELLRTIAMGG